MSIHLLSSVTNQSLDCRYRKFTFAVHNRCGFYRILSIIALALAASVSIKGNHMSADNTQKRFDVFISYSHKDADWVHDWLAPRLKQAKLTVCTDDIFDIGVPALVNMERAVAASRHTLLVLTPAWLKSEWTLFESLLVQHEAPAGVLQLTLPLLLEPCEVPKRIDILTRADFTRKKDTEAEFAKLLDAIRGKRRLPDPKPKTQEQSEPPSQNENVNHTRINVSIPRPPKVGFVVRRDRKGADIVAQLKGELAPQKNRLIALWGDGGVGKTTIAAEAVRGVAEIFANRIVWISADGRPDFALSNLLDEIASQLGEPETRKLAIEPKKETVREVIVRSDTSVLIVLDNFETISAEEQKRCVEWLDNDAPCPALITTRTRVDSARNVPIDVMTEQEANEFLNKLLEQTHNTDAFEKLDRDRIIRTAGANPLVMQWIIAQIDLAQHPSDVLDDLAHGEGDAAERVFDRSFNLPPVGDDGRDTLLALSLFVPSASRVALAEVAGFGDDVRRLRKAVESLAALCLVKTTSEERWIIEGLTRDLAKARLMRDERAEDFRCRYVIYFLRYARSYSKTTKEDFDALEAEKDNMLNSMDVAFEIQDWKSVIQTMYAIGHIPFGFLSLRGYWEEVIRQSEQAVKAALATKEEKKIADFKMNIAGVYYLRGEYNKARQLYSESFEIYKKLNNQKGIALTTWGLGNVALRQSDLENAKEQLTESLITFRELNDQKNVAGALHQLGRITQNQGEIEEAQRLYNESLNIEKRLGNQSGIAITLHNLAVIAQNQGEIEEAQRLYNESLEIKKKLGNQSGIAITLHQLGQIAKIQGEIEEAQRLYNESLNIEKRLGNQSGIAITLHNLGSLAEEEGDNTEAARLLREALSIFEKLKSPNAEAVRRSLKEIESKLK
jgi:tetratricopeptide (TPR) repeat protein